MEKAIELIEDALQAAIRHPAFAGFAYDGIIEKEINDIGGAIAFVTLDIAWRLDEALDILKEERPGLTPCAE